LSLGAPRIHGERLKLGITISERSVSRYLRGRPTTRSQTWRTFLSNTFGSQTFVSPVMFADADDEETLADASDVPLRLAQSIDVSRPSIHGPTVDPARSRRLSTLGISLAQCHSRTGARMSNGRDPPRDLRCGQPRGVLRQSFCGRAATCLRDGRQCVVTLSHTCSAVAVVCFRSTNHQVVNVFGSLTFRSIRDRLPT
jgi:hypothetical protein